MAQGDFFCINCKLGEQKCKTKSKQYIRNNPYRTAQQGSNIRVIRYRITRINSTHRVIRRRTTRKRLYLRVIRLFLL